MAALVDQLKHRGVFRAAADYAAGAWLPVQVATALFPFLELPNWSVRLIIVSAIAGFRSDMSVNRQPRSENSSRSTPSEREFVHPDFHHRLDARGGAGLLRRGVRQVAAAGT